MSYWWSFGMGCIFGLGIAAALLGLFLVMSAWGGDE